MPISNAGIFFFIKICLYGFSEITEKFILVGSVGNSVPNNNAIINHCIIQS
jgi:hypothetical protein